MKNYYVWAIVSAVLLTSSSALGADSTSVAGQVPSKVSWSGFVDVYYSKNFNSPSNQWNQLRNFDFYENQFALNLAKLTIQEQAQPVGFRVDLGIGTGNDIVQGLLNPLTGTTTPSASTLNLVEQAYLTAVIPIGSGLTVDVGKFATMMGYEVIESNGNWNYSRSLMFAWAIPYYHMGMRLTYPIAGNFTVALHVVNDWNTVVAVNKSKSVGLELSYSLTPTTAITLNGMTGFEQPTGSPYGKRDVAEFIVTQQAGDNLSFAIDGTYGRDRYLDSLKMWKGIAIYAKYNLDSKSDVALRGEIYYDPTDYTTQVTFLKATFKEITATYEYRPWDPIIVRIEARDDLANGNAFVSASTVAPSRTSQPTVLVGVIATF